MTPIVRLKRTLGTTPPASLALGELALGFGRETITKQIVIAGGTIYHYDPANPSAGWGGYNLRNVVFGMNRPGSVMKRAGLNGDHIRINMIFAPSSNPAGTLDSMWVGEQVPWPPGPSTPNFVRAPTQITFGGLTSLASAPGEHISDPIPFAFDRTRNLMIAMHFTGPVWLLEQQGAPSMNSWYSSTTGADDGSHLVPVIPMYNYGNRCHLHWATVLADPPRTTFLIPCDFNIHDNKIEAIGAGLSGVNGVLATPGAGGTAGCYARIDNFDPGTAVEMPFQTGEADGVLGAGTMPTANTWFRNGATLVAAGGDTTTVNCVGDVVFPGGAGGPAGPSGGGGGGGGGAGGPGGAGAAGAAGGGTPDRYAGAGGQGGGGGGGIGGLRNGPGVYGTDMYGKDGAELGDGAGSGGGGGGGDGHATHNAYHGIAAGDYGAGGGGGGASGSPGALIAYGGPATDGVIVVTYTMETAIKIWVGTPGGVEQLFAGTLSPAIAAAETVEDALGDGVYARSDGEWVRVPAVAPVAPANPVPNMLWCDSTTMRLHIYLQNQWVRIGA